MSLTKRKLQNAASKCIFDPRKSGPMSVIVDADDAEYFELRAAEKLRELKLYGPEARIEILQQVVSILLLAMVKREENCETK